MADRPPRRRQYERLAWMACAMSAIAWVGSLFGALKSNTPGVRCTVYDGMAEVTLVPARLLDRTGPADPGLAFGRTEYPPDLPWYVRAGLILPLLEHEYRTIHLVLPLWLTTGAWAAVAARLRRPRPPLREFTKPHPRRWAGVTLLFILAWGAASQLSIEYNYPYGMIRVQGGQFHFTLEPRNTTSGLSFPYQSDDGFERLGLCLPTLFADESWRSRNLVFRLPFWMPTLLTMWLTLRAWRSARRPPPGFCAQCGYNLTGNTTGRCSECGTAVPPRTQSKSTETSQIANSW